MPTASYTHVREHFAEVLDEVESSQEPMIITRRNRPDVALIPADELANLRATAHLLRSPRNASRLLAALEIDPKHRVARKRLADYFTIKAKTNPALNQYVERYRDSPDSR